MDSDQKKFDLLFPRTPNRRFVTLTIEEIQSMVGFFRKVQVLFPDKPMIKKMTNLYINLLIHDLGTEDQDEIRNQLRAIKWPLHNLETS